MRSLFGGIVLVLAIGVGPFQPLAHSSDWANKPIVAVLEVGRLGHFRVTLVPTPWSRGIHAEPQLWGAWGTTPTAVIAKLSVARGDTELFVPFSAYADLANVTSMSVRAVGTGLAVDILGGESGDAYRATLLFVQGGYLAKRSVAARGMPRDVWEETRYSKPLD